MSVHQKLILEKNLLKDVDINIENFSINNYSLLNC